MVTLSNNGGMIIGINSIGGGIRMLSSINDRNDVEDKEVAAGEVGRVSAATRAVLNSKFVNLECSTTCG